MKGFILSSLLAAGILSGKFASLDSTTSGSAPQARPTAENTKSSVGLTNKAKPLLLLDDEDEQIKTGADNSRCLVCHINFERELLSVVHAKTNIGCIKCHGESDAHIADESWASGGNGTAPDKMFPTNKINGFCFTCHPKSKLSQAPHKELLANNGLKPICTDCHGKHRMAKRRCKWK